MQLKKPTAEEFISGAKADKGPAKVTEIRENVSQARVVEKGREPRAGADRKTFPIVLDGDLHRELKKAAIDARMNLNEYIVSLLAKSVGFER